MRSEGDDDFPIMAGVDPTSQIENFVRNLIHVPGLRGNPERSYRAAFSEGSFYGSFEKYVAGLVHEWGSYKRLGGKYNELKSQLNNLGLANNIKTGKIDDTSISIQISRLKNSHMDDCVSVADVGFGVSQALPVLVALLCAKKDQFVYIEQPELHLHPRAQFQMADIIASALSRGIKIIIETHSSLLIRGIQTAVVKGNIDPEKVSLNWFSQNKETGGTDVNSAKLDRYGAFGDWPEDFDDVTLMAEQTYLDAVEESSCE